MTLSKSSLLTRAIKITVLAAFLYSSLVIGYDGVTGATDTTQPYDEAKLAKVSSKFGTSSAPEKKAYQKAIKAALAADVPVLKLENLSDPLARSAQNILLSDAQLTAALFEPKTKQPLRSEVMSVKPALPGDRVGSETNCWEGGCFRIDIYNFFYNATVTALVDTTAKKVVSISTMAETQPDLSQRLKDLSIAIAKNEPAVRLEVGRYLKFIGEKSKAEDILPVMADTKSALRDTLCERSKHLCVSPTYVLGDKALWVIVDLTDMKVVGLRWTTVGDSGPATIVTERKLENEYVFKNFCEQVNEVSRAGWRFDYHITTSDGLRIAQATFNKKPVFQSAKVVDWHVSYSRKDGFGYSDATGCPMFSSAVVVAYDGPTIEPIMDDDEEIGFSIAQDFRQLPWPAACNYRYEERYEFYNDGRFRVALSNLGRGCGTDGTYRPVLRMQFGLPKSENGYAMDQWKSDQWSRVENEQWVKQPAKSELNQQKYSHRLLNDKGQGYLLAPSTGDFGDGGRGDNAYIYTTVQHNDKDEGRADLVTLGSCCNKDHRQGPEQFMQPPEPLGNRAIVLWYVPQIENDGREGSRYCWAETRVNDGLQKVETWPCTGGPMFVPALTEVHTKISEKEVGQSD